MFDQGDVSSPLSILVVEDDIFQQRLLRLRLEREAFKVVTVSNASEAIFAIGQQEFAVTIVDLGLPDADGIEVIRELKVRSSQTQVIIHSADSTFKSAKEGLNLGVVGYVEKSEDLGVLINRVHFAVTKYLQDVVARASDEIRFHLRVLDVIEDGVIATNLSGELQYWNRFAVGILGGDDRFFIGGQAFNLLCMRRSSRIVSEGLDSIRSGTSISGQIRMRRSVIGPGSRIARTSFIPVRCRASPIFDRSGDVTGLVFSFADITQERRAQNAFRAFANQQAVLASIGSLAASAIEIEPFLAEVSNRIGSVLKIDQCRFLEEKSIVSSGSDVITGEPNHDKSTYYRIPIKAIHASQSTYCMVLTSRTVWQFSESDKSFVQSVSKLVENTLAKISLSTQWHSLFSNSLSSLVLLDDMGACVDANDTIARMLGYSVSDLKSMPISSLVDESSRLDFDRFWEGFRLQKKWSGELKLQTKLGTVVEARFVAVANVVPGLHMLDFDDVTEKRRLQRKVHQDLEVLSHFQRNAAIGQMAAVLAHEINQPLGAISNYVGGLLLSLKDSGLGASEQQELLGPLTNVQSQALRASEIIKRLGCFMERRPTETPCIQVNLNELILETVKYIQYDFQIHQVKLVLNLQENLPDTFGDAVQFQQVLINLIKNALEAVRDASTLEPSVLVQTHNVDEFVVVRVVDNGPGLKEPDIAKMFQPYFTTKPNGLGLGLSISQSIIEQHGGKIHASRGEKNGLQFTLHFRISDQDNLQE